MFKDTKEFPMLLYVNELDEVEGKRFVEGRLIGLMTMRIKNTVKNISAKSDINLLGADFLDLYDAQLFADYGKSYFTIKIKNITTEKTVATSITNTADINPIVFAGPIVILLVVILVYLFVRFRRKMTTPFRELQNLPNPEKSLLATSRTGSGKAKREEKESQ
uniref:Uncharacterized protein n=1 Tax=Rhizophagus irregularis (strain DAOM 181602 / DAOM 197198 / MUCL 43194) TaxID=747089 RepID=U9SIQ4_RHIID